VEIVCSFETSVNLYQTTQRHIPDDGVFWFWVMWKIQKCNIFGSRETVELLLHLRHGLFGFVTSYNSESLTFRWDISALFSWLDAKPSKKPALNRQQGKLTEMLLGSAGTTWSYDPNGLLLTKIFVGLLWLLWLQYSSLHFSRTVM
jgi:hypothetical protein